VGPVVPGLRGSLHSIGLTAFINDGLVDAALMDAAWGDSALMDAAWGDSALMDEAWVDAALMDEPCGVDG
jgi:hypothetical protein